MRGICPTCGKERALRSDGTIRNHQKWIEVRPKVWNTPRCEGGGRQPLALGALPEDQIVAAIEYQMEKQFFSAFEDFAHWVYDSELGQHLATEYEEQESDFELPSGRKFNVVVRLEEEKNA
jgi:hypothetical protein